MHPVKVSITVNGQPTEHEVEPRLLLVQYLRDVLGLTGTNIGCDTSSCGACTVLVDGEAVFSCVTPIALLEGRQVTTLEGLGSPDEPGPVQRAFIEEQAAQCGYCLSGVVLTAKAFLDDHPKASDAEVREAMSGVLCRCFAHQRIFRAIARYRQGL